MNTEQVHGSCPECYSEHLVRDYKRAEVLCEKCGLVLNETIFDRGPEWKTYNLTQNLRRERTGPPSTVLAHDKGLTTQIGWKNTDAFGKYIPHKSRAQMFRLRQWQHRIRTSKIGERTLAQGLGEVSNLSSRIGLPKQIREDAAVLYRRAANKNLARGRSIKELAAASVYAACRQSNVPRTLGEVIMEESLAKRAVGRAYRDMARELRLSCRPQTAEDYLSRFCNRLDLGQDVYRRCLEIAECIRGKRMVSGVAPTGIAAAIIYTACLELKIEKTQKEIGKVSGVTEVTLRNRFKEITGLLH
ncbi:MAG: transcription initiation factor IIB [Thermoplasmata archaeon]|nr:transcription initiation factor IIB [Thermoplasmata archaeon]